MNDIQVYWLGLKDGFAQPVQLSSGITWEDDRDKVYDHGCESQLIRLPSQLLMLPLRLRGEDKPVAKYRNPRSSKR